MDVIDEAMDLEGRLHGYIRGEVHPVWKRFFSSSPSIHNTLSLLYSRLWQSRFHQQVLYP